MEVILDAHEVEDLARDISEGARLFEWRARPIMAKVAHDIAARAQQNAPVDTGNLVNSISADVEGLSFEVGPTASYGGYVEEGTHGPYAIPNAFGWGITVMHPGNHPEPYLGPAFDVYEPLVPQALGQLAEQTALG